MSSIFDNYPQPEGYIPNNYPKLKCCKPVEIMVGETAIHTFEVPFNIEETVVLCEVIYSLGLDPVIIKNSDFSLEIIIQENNTSLVTCKLKPTETLKFKHTYLDTKVQLKFYMKDGTTTYSEIYPVNVSNALDVEHRDTIETGKVAATDSRGHVSAVGGYGYTED